MDNETVNDKFDDIDEKVDLLIEYCGSLQAENAELKSRVETLQAEVDSKNESEEKYNEQQAVIRSKIDGLLSKLNNFSEGSGQ
ncbi:MAG: cell division protein ZapB [Desulfobacteraceae bacterium]